jgi:hypothetical protein
LPPAPPLPAPPAPAPPPPPPAASATLEPNNNAEIKTAFCIFMTAPQ